MSTIGQGRRRHLLKAGLAAFAGCLLLRPDRSQAAKSKYQPKSARNLVAYQNMPAPDGHHCAQCANFIAPSSCRLLEGAISPNGHCLSFAPNEIVSRESA